MSPYQRWQELKAKGPTLAEIDAIDKATPWGEVEPDWWMEMMGVARELRKQPLPTISVHLHCTACGGTGFLGGKACHCLTPEMDAAYLRKLVRQVFSDHHMQRDTAFRLELIADRLDSIAELERDFEQAKQNAATNAALLTDALSRLHDMLHTDQTGLVAGLELVIATVREYEWTADSRGSYEWDDDEFHKEMGRMLTAVRKAAQTAIDRWKAGGIPRPCCELCSAARGSPQPGCERQP